MTALTHSQVLELYQPIIHSARELEPGCLEFQVFKQVIPDSGREELYTIERSAPRTANSLIRLTFMLRFKNIDILRQHQQGQTLKDFNEAAEHENLFESPVVVKVVGPATGFVI